MPRSALIIAKEALDAEAKKESFTVNNLAMPENSPVIDTVIRLAKPLNVDVTNLAKYFPEFRLFRMKPGEHEGLMIAHGRTWSVFLEFYGKTDNGFTIIRSNCEPYRIDWSLKSLPTELYMLLKDALRGTSLALSESEISVREVKEEKEIKEEKERLPQQQTDAEKSLWLIKGTFSQTFSLGVDLNRQVTLKNTTTDAIVSKLKLLGYSEGSYQLIAKVRDAASYDRVIAEAEKLGLSRTSFEEDFFNKEILRLRCDNLIPHGAVFLQAIRTVEPNFAEIQGRVSAELGIDLTQKYEMQSWLITGTFSRIFNSGSDLNRRVTLKNTITDAIVSELKLLGYIDGGYQLIVTVRDAASYDRVITEAEKLGLVGTSFEHGFFDRGSLTLRLRCDNLIPHGAVFLQAIRAVEPNFAEIQERVSVEFNIDLTQKYEITSKEEKEQLSQQPAAAAKLLMFSVKPEASAPAMELPKETTSSEQQPESVERLGLPFSK